MRTSRRSFLASAAGALPLGSALQAPPAPRGGAPRKGLKLGMGVFPSLKYLRPVEVPSPAWAPQSLDHRGVGHRVHGHDLLQKAVEQLAAVA